MRGISFWAGLAALALAAGVRADDATYTIKFKHAPDVNKTVTIKNHEKGTTSATLTGPDGKVINSNKETGETDETYTETVLEKGERQSKKFKRTYEKATRTVGDKKTDLPYQGRTIVFEFKDGKYEATAEGDTPLDKKVLEALAKKESSDPQAADEAVIPKKPVKVGDKWPVDVKLMAKALTNEGGPEIDLDKSKGDVKLTKVYKDEKTGAQMGMLELTLKLSIKSLGDLKFETPATGDLTVKLDVAIDGKSTSGTETSTNTFKGTASPAGQKVTIDLSVESTGTKSISAEK